MGARFYYHPERILSLTDLYNSLLSRSPRLRPRSWWVLREVSFELEAGDILGVIGKNGAGKSTLLRTIVGRIEYEEGSVELSGKAVLISPGTGFRDELSGRENIMLGGLFLGMPKDEIRSKMDEIIAFAELGEAIDRPFKYYSDGMKSRLVFSLTTSIEPEILILDEILGVGDVSFQEKAARRLQELIRRAGVIIVATHSVGFVRENCTKALYLQRGMVRSYGDPNKVCDLYLKDLQLTG
jgi:ABC-type polysaccharide/polyol phosphate transport system ATPase subunit